MKLVSRLLAVSTAVVIPLTSFAESDSQNAVVVTATRTATPLEQVGSSVTVISAEDISRRGWKTVAELLNTVPGVHAVTTGGIGAQTSVFTRGTNSSHTLVLIDGMEAADPSTPAGAFDFAHLLLEDVERIEIVTGPQSSLYGSNAVGGVINIITRSGKGPLNFSAKAERGTSDFTHQTARVSGSTDASSYAFQATHVKTAGESITPKRLRAGTIADDDGYENTTLSARLGFSPSPGIKLEATGRHTDADADLDIGSGEDPDSRSETQQSLVRLAAKGRFFGDVWQPTLSASNVHHERKVTNERQSTLGDEQNTRFRGETRKLALQNDFLFAKDNVLSIGLERKRENMKARGTSAFGSAFGDFIITEDTEVSERVNTAYVQDQFRLFGTLSGTVDVRQDRYESFDAATTYRFTPIYVDPEWNTRFKASYGTAFRAPSLYERFGLSPTNFGTAFSGNPDLKPEKNTGWELGIEQPWQSGRITTGLTLFRNKFTDLIQTIFLPSFDSTTVNIDHATTKGVEAVITAAATPKFDIEASYTRLHTKDQDGEQLLRRPRASGALDLTYHDADRFHVTVSGEYVGKRVDVERGSGSRIDVDPYSVIGLSGAYNFSTRIALFARVHNLFDRHYEPADGFQGLDRAFYIGLRGSL